LSVSNLAYSYFNVPNSCANACFDCSPFVLSC
ncbi:unnamed protein product, partial [Rotaria sordida]